MTIEELHEQAVAGVQQFENEIVARNDLNPSQRMFVTGYCAALTNSLDSLKEHLLDFTSKK